MAQTSIVTRTTRLPGAQDGTLNLVDAGGLWEDVEEDITLGGFYGPFHAGFRFPLGFARSGGLALDPPRLVTASLVLTASVAPSAPLTLQVWVVDELEAAPFSDAFPPHTLGVGGRPNQVLVYDAATDFVGLTTWTVPLNVTTQGPLGPVTTLHPTIAALARNPRWDGILTLGLNSPLYFGVQVPVFTAESTEGQPPTLLTTEAVFNTGWHTHEDRPTAAVHSMRSGLPAFSKDLVEDHFRRGVWVADREWDPEDPTDYGDAYQQDPNEGGTDSVPAR